MWRSQAPTHRPQEAVEAFGSSVAHPPGVPAGGAARIPRGTGCGPSPSRARRVATALLLVALPWWPRADPPSAPWPAVDVFDAPPAAGRVLLMQYQCGGCHHIGGVDGARGRSGPPLLRVGARSYLAGRVPNAPERLARWIVDPAALVPDTTMPAMGVRPAEARAMAAYLWSSR